MEHCDYSTPWYHGSPEKLRVLRKGSWVTQFKEMAKAFSHRPSLISLDDDCQAVKHDGQRDHFRPVHPVRGSATVHTSPYSRSRVLSRNGFLAGVPIRMVGKRLLQTA